MKLDERNLLRAMVAERVYRKGDKAFWRGGANGQNKRVKAGDLAAVIAAGWVLPEPDGEGRYVLTDTGRVDLAARESGSNR